MTNHQNSGNQTARMVAIRAIVGFVTLSIALTCFFLLLTVSLTRFFVLRIELVRLSMEEDRDIVPLGLAGGLSSTACSIACSAARWRRVATIVCGLRAAMACLRSGAAASWKSMSVWRFKSVPQLAEATRARSSQVAAMRTRQT